MEPTTGYYILMPDLLKTGFGKLKLTTCTTYLKTNWCWAIYNILFELNASVLNEDQTIKSDREQKHMSICRN